MSWEERKKVLEVAVKAANGRVPVVAGSNGTNINEVIDFAQHAEKVGSGRDYVVVSLLFLSS